MPSTRCKKNGALPIAALATLRRSGAALAQQCRTQVHGTAGVLVHADPDGPPPCPRCGLPMRVRKTLRRTGQTLEHGVFRACETEWVCGHGCHQEVPASAGGAPQTVAVTQRSERLARLLLPRRAVGYSGMTFVGVQRCLHHRQREDIRATLEAAHGIRLSSGAISALAHDFVVYREALHQARAPQLKAALDQDGGWPMPIDATGENGRGTLLVVYAGWRRWVLGSGKIPTERADAILPRLHQVADRFGPPCASMRDLGRAMLEASRDFVAQRALKIRVLGCHFHFLKDVGQDLLEQGYDQLRALFRRFEIRGHLRALARDLGRQLGADSDGARTQLEDWLTQRTPGHALPDGGVGLAAGRALTQWVLDYPADGHDEGFPFDLPYLDLWRRCRTALSAVEAFLGAPGDNGKVQKTLERLHRIVEPVRTQVPFQRPAAVLEARARLFAELRQALRLRIKPTAEEPAAAFADARALGELQDIHQAVEALTASLQARRPERGPAQNARQAIDLILDHLERHGPSLAGHAIPFPGGGTRLVDRTNLALEGFYGGVKQGERRRSGRKTLTQDLENLPGGAPLATNLDKPDYVAILCGGLDHLPAAFAELDAVDRRRALPVRKRATPDEPQDVVSPSLPCADRYLIRSDDLRQRVLAAARSRAPHRLPSGKCRAATEG